MIATDDDYHHSLIMCAPATTSSDILNFYRTDPMQITILIDSVCAYIKKYILP